MKIVGFISKEKEVAEVCPLDLAGIVGLNNTCRLADKLKEGMNYSDFKPEIVGTIIKTASIFADAAAALNTHKEALAAAKQLKAASSRFLGFFADDK